MSLFIRRPRGLKWIGFLGCTFFANVVSAETHVFIGTYSGGGSPILDEENGELESTGFVVELESPATVIMWEN